MKVGLVINPIIDRPVTLKPCSQCHSTSERIERVIVDVQIMGSEGQAALEEKYPRELP